MDSKDIFSSIVLALCFTAGGAITVSVVWLVFRQRMKALEVLRVYAERGEEPPDAVVDAVYGRVKPAPPTPPTRGRHLSHAAPNAIIAAGMAGMAWWRFSAFDETGRTVVIPMLVALFFAGALAARLVGAYYAPDR
jgi:hypothetical protein